ncbi:MAG: V-type ATP synthase subunit I [Thermoproteota archaeon]
MFRPARMKKIRLVLPTEQEDRFLREIGELGILQVKTVEKKPPRFSPDVNVELEKNSLLNLVRRCDAILNKLPKEGIIVQLIGKSSEKLPDEEEDEIYGNAQKILNNAEDKLNKWEKLRILKLSTKKQLSLRVFSLLKDNLIVLRRARRTDYLVILEGWVKMRDANRLIEIIPEPVKSECLISLEESGILGREVLKIRLATITQNYSILEEALSSHGVASFSGGEGEGLKAEEAEDIEEAINISSIKQQIALLKKVLLKRLEVLKAKASIVRAESSIYLEGWIKEKDLEKLVSMLKKSYSYELSVEDPQEWEEPPVALENPPVIRSFETITLMFGTPGYRQIDPTPLLSLTYAVFFGLMFADVLDGMLLLIFSFLLYRGLGSRSREGRRLSEILVTISISSIIFGFLTGEFMGDAVKIPVLWFNGFEDPMYFLQVAILLGVVQLTAGLAIGFVNELLLKRFRNAFGEKLAWLMLLYGSIIVLLYYSNGGFYLYFGSTIAVSGLILLTIVNPRNLMEVTRLVSNVVSYARIVAINISHAGISRAFTLLASPLIYSGNPIVGLLAGGTILLVTHFFIVFIESFIAFAHSLRLHFVEFFSKFFESTGNIFKPISLAW